MNVRRISAAGVAVLAAGGLTGATLGTGEKMNWTADTVTVREGEGTAVLTVARDMCNAGPVRIDHWAPYDVEDPSATATPGEDFASTHASTSFLECGEDGSGRATVTVPILDDELDEPREQFGVGLQVRHHGTSTGPLPSIDDPEATVVITDDDGTVGLATQDVTVKEADGVARVTLTPSGIDEPTPIDVETFAGTAKPGDDFAPQDTGIRVEDDEPVTVEIPLTVDATPEPDEQFRVMFEYGEQQEYATVTVTDPAPPTQTTETTPTTPTETTTQSTTTAPVAPQQTQRSVSQRPPAKCVSRRSFSIRLGEYRSATVKVGGTRMKTVRRGGTLVAQVDLRGRPKGAFSVTIAGRAAEGGAKRTETRRYRTCTPRSGKR